MKPTMICLAWSSKPSQALYTQPTTHCSRQCAELQIKQWMKHNLCQRGPGPARSWRKRPQRLWTTLRHHFLHFVLLLRFGVLRFGILRFGMELCGYPNRKDPQFLRSGSTSFLREANAVPSLRGVQRLGWFDSNSRRQKSLQPEERDYGPKIHHKPPPSTLLVLVTLTLLATTIHPTLAARAGRRGGDGDGDGRGNKGESRKDLMQLRCPPCRQIHCAIRDPKELGCKGGVTTGVCGCCPACARLLGETCGGDLSYLGKCDQGLTCLAPHPPSSSPLPAYRMQREPPGVCTKEAVRTTEQADEAFTKQCRPRCTQHFCSRRPRAVCSARKGVAETERPCQGNCQHTSCRACAMVDDVECVRCAGHDFRCLKQFGRCVARQRCRGKAGRKYCKRSRLRGNIGRRFVCKVPECPS